MKYIEINKRTEETKNSQIAISKSLYLIITLIKIKTIKQKSILTIIWRNI